MGLKIVQIGANRGNDDLTEMIRSLPSPNLVERLVLVEPLEVHHVHLRACYEDFPVEVLTIAVTPTPDTGEITFYYHLDDGPKFEVASLDKAHILKHARFNPNLADESRLVEASVPSLPLGALLKDLGLWDLGILFMDCEGSDGDIVCSLGESVGRIRNIYFENCHLKDDGVYEFLAAHHYEVTRNCLTNGWMSHAALSRDNMYARSI